MFTSVNFDIFLQQTWFYESFLTRRDTNMTNQLYSVTSPKREQIAPLCRMTILKKY